jgi:chaperone clpB
MEKKTYKKAQTKKVFLAIEPLMLVASPGVGGEYDPHKPIDSKGADFFDEDEDESIGQRDNGPVWKY